MITRTTSISIAALGATMLLAAPLAAQQAKPGVTPAPTTPAPATAAPAAKPAAPAAQAAPAASAPTAAATPPAPPVPVPFAEAVTKAATMLFANAKSDGKLDVTIDPLIDGVTGVQTVAGGKVRLKIQEIARKNHPNVNLLPFSVDTVSKSPVVLVGTFTAINTAGQAKGPRDAYRVCLALADLKTGKIVSKGLAFAKPEGVDPTPVAFFRDSPVWTQDESTMGYIRTCQGTKAGDEIRPVYVQRIKTAAMLSDAILAYDVGKYPQALALYQKAAQTDGGDQLRVWNGLYLTNAKLNRRKEAEEAFGKIVDFGLKGEKLAAKILFRPGGANYVRQRSISGAYPMWLKQIATRGAAKNSCMEIVGHTSPTGSEETNQKISLARAERIRAQLIKSAPSLDKRLIANGVASKENLIGTGRDDASDALDRRVEFKGIGC